MITINEIKENIKCPQFGDLEYGKWGALRLEQREAFKHLIDIVEDLQQENKQLKEALKDIEELLLSEEQPVQPCNIRYDILEIIKKVLGDKETEEIPLFEGTLEQLNNLSILGDKENINNNAEDIEDLDARITRAEEQYDKQKEEMILGDKENETN